MCIKGPACACGEFIRRMSSSVGLLMPSLPNQAALQCPVPSGAEAKASTAAVSTCTITLHTDGRAAFWCQSAHTGTHLGSLLGGSFHVRWNTSM